MPTERYDIIVTDRISPRVSKKLSQISRSASGADKALVGFSKRLLKIGAIIQAARTFVKLSDSFTLIENKIRNVTDSMEDLNFVTNEVFEVANRSRTNVLATAQAFQRFDLALMKSGASQKEVLRLTETLNKAMVLGGATTQEQTSGLLQLSQAFNEGVLRGQEFRIISQTMPAVLDKVSKQLGVTRGDLKKMSAQGKLTTDVLREALGGMEKEIDEKFVKLVPTIGQAWQVFSNDATKAIGLVNKELGASGGLAEMIIKAGTLLKDFAAVGTAVFNTVSESVTIAGDIIKEKWGESIATWWKDTKSGFEIVMQWTKFFTNFFIGAMLGSAKTVIDAWFIFPEVMADIIVMAKNKVLDGIELMTNGVISGINGVMEVLNALRLSIGQKPLFDNLLGDVDLSKFKGELSGALLELDGIAKAAFGETLSVDYVGDFVKNIKEQIEAFKAASGAFREESKKNAFDWSQVWGEAAKKNLKHLSGFWKNLATLQDSNSKKMQRVGKAAAITQATIDTYRGANAAYADTPGAVWVKAAAAASAVIAGLVNVRNIASAGNFANGGFVGGTSFSGDNVPINTNSGEAVLNASQQRNFMRMANGQTSGTSSSGATVNVTVENYGSSDIQVQQMGPNDVRIIARDVLRQESDGVTAANLSNPNSRTSRAQVANTNTQRKRR